MDHERPPAGDRRVRLLRQVYDDAVLAAYDPQLDLINVSFAGCIMNTAEDVVAAFAALDAKVGALLAWRGRERLPLLVDIARLDIAPACASVWGVYLKRFLDARCLQAGPTRHLVARYSSSQILRGLTATQRQILRETSTQGLQANVCASREEALALLYTIRDSSAPPGP